MRVVLDTNSLLVSIGRKSKYRPIFDALLSGKIKLLISNDIVNEYVEILEEKTSAIVAENDDRHFNVLKKVGFPPVRIIRTAAFLEELKSLK